VTISEMIETLELMKYEAGGDPETGVESVQWATWPNTGLDFYHGDGDS
jgi:hypothetical protein